MTDLFDERAATWDDDPSKVERARDAAAAMRRAVRLGPDVRLLEYGAGTGLLAEQLVADVGPITLAEPSRGMREVLRSKVDDGRLPDARIWDLDLSRDAPPGERFDVIAALMALHHIPELARVLSGFAELLEPGGAVCIIDLEADPAGSFHGSDFGGHHGFDRDELEGWLRDAGLSPTRFDECHTVVRDGREYPLFLAVSLARPGASRTGAGDAAR